MSVAAGIAPGELLELEWPMFEAVERAAALAYSARYLLAVQTVEGLDRLRYVLERVHAGKGQRPQPVVRVPLPTGDEWLAPTAPAVERVSAATFALEYGPASSRRPRG